MKNKEKISLAVLIILILTRIIFLHYNNRQLERKVSNEKIDKLKQIQELTEQEMFLVKEEFLNDDNNVIGQVEYKYNDQGDLFKVNYINEVGESIEKKQYQYNDDGNKEKIIIETTTSNWQEYSWRFFSKDMTEFRAQREVEDFTSFRRSSKANYEYNKLGQLIAYEKIDKNGDFLRKINIKYHNNSEKKQVIELKGNDYVSKLKYNQSGQLKKEIIKDGFFTEVREYKYDKQENEIKTTMTRKNNKDKLTRKRVSKSNYDQQGNKLSDITVSKTYINADVIERYFNYQYKYDKNRNKIETIALDEDGELLQRINYKYDKLGNKIMEKRYKYDGRITYHFENTYQADAENNTIVVKKEDMINNKLIKDKYKYDAFGNLIRVKLRNEAGEIEKNKRYIYQIKKEIN